jgi:hypothetical protein
MFLNNHRVSSCGYFNSTTNPSYYESTFADIGDDCLAPGDRMYLSGQPGLYKRKKLHAGKIESPAPDGETETSERSKGAAVGFRTNAGSCGRHRNFMVG